MERSQNRDKFDFEEKLMDYAIRVVRLTEELPDNRAANYVARELLISGTAPMNIHAAPTTGARGFIDKLSDCLTHLRDSNRWLTMIQQAPLVDRPSRIDPLIEDSVTLIKIFFSSLRTARDNQDRK